MNISSVTALIMDATAAAFQFNFEMNGRARNPRQRAGRKRPVPVTIDFYGPAAANLIGLFKKLGNV